MFNAKVICDSVADHGVRLITVEATYPRFIHSELMTHRAFARNAASSRAIPWERKFLLGDLHPKCMKYMIMNNPVVPLSFDMEQKGMQSGDAIGDQEHAKALWLRARDSALWHANELAKLGVHKSLVNRVVEPWMWITTLITATDWKNFFRLRIHPAAEKHFQHIARMIKDAIDASTPTLLEEGDWHTPYIREDDRVHIFQYGTDNPEWRDTTEITKYVSAGRCARLSYLTHDGRRDISEDIRLCKQLINPRSAGLDDDVIHASPLEHVCMPMLSAYERSGPFRGWFQFRKEFLQENVI